MSDNNTHPKSTLFKKAVSGQSIEKSTETKLDAVNLDKLKKVLPSIIKRVEKGNRAQRFLPFLLIRTGLGDRGTRPLSTDYVFWESPDIWVSPQDPSNPAPEIPATYEASPISGVPNNIYAHVWNLGLAPLVGINVSFYVFDPSFLFQTDKANLIGVARVDLPPRSSTSCHKLVRCPNPWIPDGTKAHQCIVVRISGVGDSINSKDSWDPRTDRHVAQHNVTVVTAGTSIDTLLASLENNRKFSSKIVLQQIGKEATTVVNQAARNYTIDSSVQTHILAELKSDGSLTLPPVQISHKTNSIITSQTSVSASPFAIRRIQPDVLLNLHSTSVKSTDPTISKSGDVKILDKGGNVSMLLNHATLLTPEFSNRLVKISSPKQNQVQVMRLIAYDDKNTMIGGYTIVIKGL